MKSFLRWAEDVQGSYFFGFILSLSVLTWWRYSGFGVESRTLFPFSFVTDAHEKMFFPFADALIVFLMVFISAGVEKILFPSAEEEKYQDDSFYEYLPYSGMFGFFLAIFALLADWILVFVLDGFFGFHLQNAVGILVFIAAPIFIGFYDLISDWLKSVINKQGCFYLKGEVVGLWAFLSVFFGTLIFFSGIYHGWAFPWALIFGSFSLSVGISWIRDKIKNSKFKWKWHPPKAV